MKTKYILSLAILLTLSLTSKSQQYSEYEVKLVYLYQSLKYINWPDDKLNNEDSFTIGIYGSESIYSLAHKMFNSRKLYNKSCKTVNITNIDDAKTCNVIYIISSQRYETIQLIKQLNNQSILTIGDGLQDFCQNGGMINFTDKTEKMRLELCPENIKDKNLQVSSQLYAISKIIKLQEAVF